MMTRLTAHTVRESLDSHGSHYPAAWAKSLAPMHEEVRRPSGHLHQERPRSAIVAPQPLVFLSRPTSQMLVQEPEALVQLGFVVASVIVEPASHNGIYHLCQVPQGLVTAPVQVPVAHSLPYRLARCRADTRTKAVEQPAVLAPGSARSELIPRECKCHVLV